MGGAIDLVLEKHKIVMNNFFFVRALFDKCFNWFFFYNFLTKKHIFLGEKSIIQKQIQSMNVN